MKDIIRWIVSVILSVLFIWFLFLVDQSLPNFVNRILTYGASTILIYVLSDIVCLELGKLQDRAAKAFVKNKDNK